jgi:hypothetical protein
MRSQCKTVKLEFPSWSQVRCQGDASDLQVDVTILPIESWLRDVVLEASGQGELICVAEQGHMLRRL